uniref:Uncharacterized protein n=1 Tax=Oryza nivara TaxID=4536 RepID=A0A0E0I0H6_ORYNI
MARARAHAAAAARRRRGQTPMAAPMRSVEKDALRHRSHPSIRPSTPHRRTITTPLLGWLLLSPFYGIFQIRGVASKPHMQSCRLCFSWPLALLLPLWPLGPKIYYYILYIICGFRIILPQYKNYICNILAPLRFLIDDAVNF